MIILRELTAASFMMGPFVDSTDGFTAKTALVLTNGTIRVAKNGGAFAAKNASDSAVHKENGYYGFNLSVTDVNTTGILLIAAVTSGALPVWYECLVMASPVYDSLILGSDRLQVDVEEMANNIITSSVLAANSIGASQIADGAIDAASIASNAITSAKIATDAIGAAQIADGAIDAGAIASNAITAAKIATDAIGAAQLAADAVTEIQSGLSTLTAAGVRTAVGLASANLDTQLGNIYSVVDTEVAAIKAKTDQLTFTVSNKVDAVSQLSTQGKADVNAEVVDTLSVDTYSELAALPGASPTLAQILMFVYEIGRNKLTTTATEQKLYKDNGSTILGTWTVSDDGSTFTKSEIV